MLSSAMNPAARGDSTMPGDYEPFLGGPQGRSPFPGPGAMIPPTNTPIPQLTPRQRAALSPAPPPIGGLSGRRPFPRMPMTPRAGRPRMRRARLPSLHHPVRVRHHRRRSLTPEIVIERRSHCRSSCGGRRLIAVPLDCRPTLGLRGSPRRMLEIERVRCCRTRRHHPVCYDRDYDYDHHHHHPPQPTTLIANPSLPLSNHAAVVAAPAVLPHLTPELIQSLPRQTVHLEPIHMPGSQANADTQLNTVVLPAELINPVDGTLSVIQANPQAIGGGIVAAPVLPQALSLPTIAQTPTVPRGPAVSAPMASDATMQRFRQLFQRLNLQRAQQLTPGTNPAVLPFPSSELSPNNNAAPNPPIINSANPRHVGFNLPDVSPTRPTNITTIPSATSVNNRTYRPVNPVPSNFSDIGPYRPANITPYSSTRYANNTSSPPSFASRPTPYASTASLASTHSFTTNAPSPPAMDANALNLSSSSPSLPLTTFQPMNSAPKSILRNGPATNFSYSPLGSPQMFSPSDATRTTTRFT